MSATVEPTNETLPAPPATAAAQRPHSEAAWTTLALGLSGSLLCYLAQPPVGWSLLAWIGPAPWFYLARLPQMPGRRPYAVLWLAGAVYWLAAIQWIRLPHHYNIFGLFFLAAYLGAYLPVAVGLTRTAVFRVGAPLWLAAPVAWTGLEWVRARLLTGFLMASLAHTQVHFTAIIQIADILGEYGVTFLVTLVAASLGEFAHRLREPGRWRLRRLALAVAPAAVAILLAYGYGRWKLAEDQARVETDPAVTIVLVQSDMLADWKGTPARDEAAVAEMAELSRDAVRRHGAVDLVVWPETMYRTTLHQSEEGYRPPRDLLTRPVDELFGEATDYLGKLARELNSPLLVGLDRVFWTPRPADPSSSDEADYPFVFESFNSSAAFDRTGLLVGTYDKMHLLPFGEYIPFVSWLPFLRQYSPITGGASPGRGPTAIEIDGVIYSPNICYETVLPHLIRRQAAELAAQGKTPDVLVNLTNDAWYWGSSELDMHLASGVFRAVEMRTPLVAAANRGLSAYVDRCGRIVAATERDVPAALTATVRLPRRGRTYPSLFAAQGDWFALVCLLCCTVLATIGWRRRPIGSTAKLCGR